MWIKFFVTEHAQKFVFRYMQEFCCMQKGEMDNSKTNLLQYIEQSQIGYDATARSAYGAKPGEFEFSSQAPNGVYAMLQSI